MRIPDLPFSFVDWSREAAERHAGASGMSEWRTFSEGDLRVRMVDYSPGFRSDHWCPRGHVLLVLEGELTIELKDGRVFEMKAGTSFQVGDDETNPHLARTERGSRVFIVD